MPWDFTLFTNDLPLVLHEARMMYADDSKIYMSAPKANELTEILNKELQTVSEWVIHKKLVLNTVHQKVKALYLVPKHSQRPKAQLELKKLNS